MKPTRRRNVHRVSAVLTISRVSGGRWTEADSLTYFDNLKMEAP